jgi:hypothetical protein
MDICKVIAAPALFDGRVIVVYGFIYAGGHDEGIEGDTCSRGAAISYNIDSMPKDFVSAITDKRLRLDLRPLKVTVEGRFRKRVPARLGHVSRIDVSKALSWEFVGDKTTSQQPR